MFFYRNRSQIFFLGSCPTNGAFPKLMKDKCYTLKAPASSGTEEISYIGCDTANGYGTYDCIDALPYPLGTAASLAGYCCPSRGTASPFRYTAHINSKQSLNSAAMACIQPLDSGRPAGFSVLRYWYNSITQTCQQFQYLGEGGNANNFASLDQCQSYCNTGMVIVPAHYV